MTPSIPLSLSPAAIKHLVALKALGKNILRVRITSGGCSGLQYDFTFEDHPQADDIHIRQEGAEVIIDPISLSFVTGSQLDYVEELIGSYLTLKNPNAQNSCGCGSSFTV